MNRLRAPGAPSVARRRSFVAVVGISEALEAVCALEVASGRRRCGRLPRRRVNCAWSHFLEATVVALGPYVTSTIEKARLRDGLRRLGAHAGSSQGDGGRILSSLEGVLL